MSTLDTASTQPANFIRTIVAEDLQSGKHQTIVTRFPPEPNGYLHIGHAKSICLNFGVARDYSGRCHLRFDDTNPVKEDVEYTESIKGSVRWLGFDWGEDLYYASDYFGQLYEWAEHLIKAGKAYVDDLSAEEMRSYRGTLTEPGKESPFRGRAPEENLDLFRRMKAGEFADGSKVLRARIDMASPNINLRDPVMYRILRATHPHTGDAWCIYPMYDYAHGQSDAIEGVTHSICTLEFEDHKPLYEWFLTNLPVPATPKQYEFARLNLTYTVMSKRKLLQLVQDGDVAGWDDPRMPTLVGLRRRGYTPESIRTFCERIGVGRSDSWIDMSTLEECVREDLNSSAPRAMAVLRPLRLVLENYPEGEEELSIANHPQNPEFGTRNIPFCQELFIEEDDFQEVPEKGFKRLTPGGEVRLRGAYIIRCVSAEKDADGRISTIRCTYDPETLSGRSQSDRKVKGVVHWVSARHSITAQVRLYDRLISVATPGGDDWKGELNSDSIEILDSARLEPSLAEAAPEARFQFERQGYFCVDAKDSAPGRPVFNRTVTLRDSWGKK